jgi:aspartyl-tRNA synthetase
MSTKSTANFAVGQELLSVGQRVHKPEQLVETIKSKGLDPNQPGLKEYVDVFRSVGVPPHGGMFF